MIGIIKQIYKRYTTITVIIFLICRYPRIFRPFLNSKCSSFTWSYAIAIPMHASTMQLYIRARFGESSYIHYHNLLIKWYSPDYKVFQGLSKRYVKPVCDWLPDWLIDWFVHGLICLFFSPLWTYWVMAAEFLSLLATILQPECGKLTVYYLRYATNATCWACCTNLRELPVRRVYLETHCLGKEGDNGKDRTHRARHWRLFKVCFGHIPMVILAIMI